MEDERQREAREILERVRRESETLGQSAMDRAGQRLADHFSGADGGDDRTEVWGRRIGRALSVVLFCYLAWELGQTLMAR